MNHISLLDSINWQRTSRSENKELNIQLSAFLASAKMFSVVSHSSLAHSALVADFEGVAITPFGSR